jgi:hypothetical protein
MKIRASKLKRGYRILRNNKLYKVVFIFDRGEHISVHACNVDDSRDWFMLKYAPNEELTIADTL